ncbi:MAG: GLPGLI family protein [Niabella sp.]
MKRLSIIILVILMNISVQAQQWVTEGVIEYEVKTNQRKQYEGDEFFAQMLDKIPQFVTNYYKCYFADNKSLYKFDRKAATAQQSTFFFGPGQDESEWFNDYNTGTYTNLATIEGYIQLSGEQKKIDWKIFPDDQREIAGFNCRKAQTVLFDSVYVFVYYTDQITMSGGPMGLHGLPGMILGVTVPRMYTSWMATTVQLTRPVANIVKAPTKGKKKTMEEIKTDIGKLAKSWGSDSRKWLDQMLWRVLL